MSQIISGDIVCQAIGLRFGFVSEYLSTELSVLELCDLVKVKPADYYYWQRTERQRSLTTKQESELLTKIKEIFKASSETYDSPRVLRSLSNL